MWKQCCCLIRVTVALSHTQKNREQAFVRLRLYHFQPKLYSLLDYVFKSYPFLNIPIICQNSLYVSFYSHIFISLILKYTGRIILYTLDKKGEGKKPL